MSLLLHDLAVLYCVSASWLRAARAPRVARHLVARAAELLAERGQLGADAD